MRWLVPAPHPDCSGATSGFAIAAFLRFGPLQRFPATRTALRPKVIRFTLSSSGFFASCLPHAEGAFGLPANLHRPPDVLPCASPGPVLNGTDAHEVWGALRSFAPPREPSAISRRPCPPAVSPGLAPASRVSGNTTAGLGRSFRAFVPQWWLGGKRGCYTTVPPHAPLGFILSKGFSRPTQVAPPFSRMFSADRGRVPLMRLAAVAVANHHGCAPECCA